MALTDTRTIAIGVVIGLLVGGGIGYLLPQSKISELTTDISELNRRVSELEYDNDLMITVLDDTEAVVESQKEDIGTLEALIDELTDEKEAIEAEYAAYKVVYQEMWDDYNELIQDYNALSTTPVGQMTFTEISGIINGDFEDEEDWLKQGKGGIGWGAAYLHQYETFSTYLTQNIYLDSSDKGIKFDVKPEPLGGSVGLQVRIGDVMVYDDTFTGPNSAYDFESVVIPFDVFLKMREYYDLPVEGIYALKFTIPSGPESGALVVIDTVSLVTLSYQPEQPSN